MLPNRFAPKKLRRQLIMHVATLLTLGIALSIWFFTQYFTQAQTRELQHQIQQGAQSLARQVAQFNNARNNTTLEALVLQLAESSHVLQVDISDPAGRRLIGAKRDRSQSNQLQNAAYLVVDPLQAAPDAPPQPGPILSDTQLVVWHNCEACKHKHGDKLWIRVVADTRYIALEHEQLFFTLILMAAVLVFLTTDAFIFYNAKAMKQLGQIDQFAQHLSQSKGQQLNLKANSVELQNIADSLDRLSSHWFHLQNLAESSHFKSKTKSQLLDEHAMVCITDTKGVIQDVNDSFCNVSQYTKQELVGKRSAILNAGIQDQEHYKLMWRMLSVGRVWQGEFCNRKKHGDLYWVKATIVPICDDAGKLLFYASAQTELKQALPTPSKQSVM